jgi:hypothetical protein
VQDEDIVSLSGTTWSVYFDGTAHGLTAGSQDIDAISFPTGALAPAPLPATQPLTFSIAGNGVIPGVAGPWSGADVFSTTGLTYSRFFTASTGGVGASANANIDGFDRVDATHFFVSFSTTTVLAGLGVVEDEDVVYNNNGVWQMYFDGSLHGLGGNGNLDLDAISVVGSVAGAGGTLYFSTAGNSNPPGVAGTADDADIYSWNGTSYARVWDATANGLAGSADVDGYVRVDATHFYLTFSGVTTTVPGPLTVEDEDVVYDNAGTWSVYFDGTAQGLVAAEQDVDAIDVP